MATSFSLTNQLKVTAAWVEPFGLTNVAVTDQTRLTEATVLTNGNGAFQATGYWKDQLSCNAGQTVVDVLALPHKAFGGTATLGFASLKMVLLLNRSTSHAVTVFAAATNALTSIAEGPITLAPEGVLYLMAPGGGWLTSSAQRIVAIDNPNAESVSIDAYLAGVIVQ